MGIDPKDLEKYRGNVQKDQRVGREFPPPAQGVFRTDLLIKDNNVRQTVIYGDVPSKSNSYGLTVIAGRAKMYKTARLKEYEDQFFMECNQRGRMIKSFFGMRMDVYYSSLRPDMDNALKIILDCLQTCKVIKNDRYLAELMQAKFKDRQKPRIEFGLYELTNHG